MPQIFAEFVGCHFVDQSMPITVRTDFVPRRLNVAHQLWKSFCDPAENKESAPRLRLVKQAQHCMSVGDDAAGELLPLLPVDNAGKRLHLKIIFDVDGERVLNGVLRASSVWHN